MPRKIDLSGNNTPNLTVSKQELQSLVDRYKNQRYARFVPSPVRSDSRAIWLSKAALDTFFANNPDSDGLRFYFGVIDDINHLDGAHNMIIVATDKTGTDNIDRMGDSDSVIVTETFNIAFTGDAIAALCPPPNKPCSGNTLTY